MKTKNLVIIFILFFLITLASGLAFFLTRGNNQPVGANQRQEEIIKDKLIPKAAAEIKSVVQPEKIARPETAKKPAEEKIGVVIIIIGAKYEVEMKPGSSVYDLMSALKGQKKIDFKSSNYSGMGYFIEEINGVKNNQSGMNWLYYVNGQPAKIGVSFYRLKANDTIEWKYEKKSF